MESAGPRMAGLPPPSWCSASMDVEGGDLARRDEESTNDPAVSRWRYPRSLDLRQYGALTERDLDMLPSSLERLAIGPYFGASLTVTDIIDRLPMGRLTHLDLDLSKTHCNDAVERDEAVARLRGRSCGRLEHLGLRMLPPQEDHGFGNDGEDLLQPAMPGDGLARAVAGHWLGTTAGLRSLDLSGNLIGDAGVRALLARAASLHAYNGPTLRHLNLSRNQLTSASCQLLASLLAGRSAACGLRGLDLSHNDGIGAGFAVLADALRDNASLRHLSLVGCPRLMAAAEKVVYPLLLDLLEHCNTTLCSVTLSPPPSSSSSSAGTTRWRQQQQRQIDTWLLLNRTGRGWLRRPPNAAGLWPRVLARAERLERRETGKFGAESLYYLLRNTVGHVWAAEPK